jgi:hypothetical protein
MGIIIMGKHNYNSTNKKNYHVNHNEKVAKSNMWREAQSAVGHNEQQVRRRGGAKSK